MTICTASSESLAVAVSSFRDPDAAAEEQLLQLEVKQLQLALADAQQDAQDSKEAQAQANSQLEQVQEANTKLSRRIHELEGTIRSLQHSATSARERAEQAEDMAAGYEDELSSAQEQLASLRYNLLICDSAAPSRRGSDAGGHATSCASMATQTEHSWPLEPSNATAADPGLAPVHLAGPGSAGLGDRRVFASVAVQTQQQQQCEPGTAADVSASLRRAPDRPAGGTTADDAAVQMPRSSQQLFRDPVAAADSGVPTLRAAVAAAGTQTDVVATVSRAAGLDRPCSPAAVPPGQSARGREPAGPEAAGETEALWAAVNQAQEAAAAAAAGRSEAEGMVSRLQRELEHARRQAGEFVAGVQGVLAAEGEGSSGDSQQLEPSLLLLRVQERLKLHQQLRRRLEAVEGDLAQARERCTKLDERLEYEVRNKNAVSLTLTATQSQLEHWQAKARALEGAPTTPRPAPRHVQPPSDSFGECSADVTPASDVVPSPNAVQGVVEGVDKLWRVVSLKCDGERRSLQAGLVAQQKAVQALRSQVLALEQQLESAEDQLEEERARLGATRSEAQRRSEDLISALHDCRQQVADRDKELNDRKMVYETSQHALAASHKRVEALEELLRVTESELRAAMDQIATVRGDADALDERLRVSEAAREELVVVGAEAENLVRALRKATGQVPPAGRSHGTTTIGLGPTAAVLQEAGELVQLQERALQEQRALVERARKDAEAVQRELEYERAAGLNLQQQLSEAAEEADAQAGRLQMATAEAQRLRATAERQSSEAADNRSALDLARTAEAAMRAEVQQLQQELTRLQEDTVLAKRDASEANAGANDLAMRLAAREREVAAQRGQVHSLQSALEDAQVRAAKAAGESRELHREVAATLEARCAAESTAAGASEHIRKLASQLHDAEGRVLAQAEALEKRNQEVRELQSMLKAWEAMRLSKDAQIAALMERCKRYDEDIAEKGRSNDALRRKLQHHGSFSRAPSVTGSERSGTRGSAPSTVGSLTGHSHEGFRQRHIHVHVHPSLSASDSGPLGTQRGVHGQGGTGRAAIGASTQMLLGPGPAGGDR